MTTDEEYVLGKLRRRPCACGTQACALRVSPAGAVASRRDEDLGMERLSLPTVCDLCGHSDRIVVLRPHEGQPR